MLVGGVVGHEVHEDLNEEQKVCPVSLILFSDGLDLDVPLVEVADEVPEVVEVPEHGVDVHVVRDVVPVVPLWVIILDFGC